MKKIFKIAVVVLMMMPAVSFAQKAKVNWPEMKAFHGMMSTSFHPAEEGKFDPIRQKSDSLYQAAVNWNQSTIPAGFKPEETKKTLLQLVENCRVVSKLVEGNAPNEKIMAALTEAHDVFHKIVGECREE
jgi:hypothetical protein